MEIPMVVLGIFWLVLLIVEFIWGLNRLMEGIGIAIWVVFLCDFALKFILAPRKFAYLRTNWLTAFSLILPALRIFRIVRALRVFRAASTLRGIRLVRVVSSLNRGMRVLGTSMARRGFSYVASLTLIVIFVGAAGMYAFEKDIVKENGLSSYGAALWWTAMIMTTFGSDYWPRSPEGRALCLLLCVYAVAVFGYVTATLAIFFIGRDAENENAELASAKSIKELRQEIQALRADIKESNRCDS